MQELALHVMDIAENGLAAGANLITILIRESTKGNRLEITVRDNGRGIPPGLQQKVLDPFYTSRTTRRVGLGLSLLKEATRRCEGEFRVDSQEDRGTEVTAAFRRDHIDLAPLGDMARSLTVLVMGNAEVDFVYRHRVDEDEFELDTRQIKTELEGVPIEHPEVLRYLTETIRESLAELKAGQYAGTLSV